jgi:hypothetical protein
VLQFKRHVALAVALPVVVAVVVVLVVGSVPCTTQADWQIDPLELHPIMQVVTVEVWASRIRSVANALSAVAVIASATTRILRPRMPALRGSVVCPHDSALGGMR